MAIPVIFDTDLGDDIDDVWALAMLLRSPELAPQLILTAYRDTEARAKIAAKALAIANRADIPIGIGLRGEPKPEAMAQYPWAADYDLGRYPGRIYADGVQAMIDFVRASPEPITLIAIAPTPNIAEALRRAPDIAGRIHYVGMQGSVYRGYQGSPEPSAEWNVVADIASCQKTFAAPWKSMTITPLDSCGVVQLNAEEYRVIANSADPLMRAVVEGYRIWLRGTPDTVSSILYDTVAVFLAYSRRWLKMETLRLLVDDKGYTRIHPQGQPMAVAVGWFDLPAYRAYLVKRLLGEV